jgi:hypothetical protein
MAGKQNESAEDPENDLGELLEETRILLPGSEVLVAFLISLPFTNQFAELTNLQRGVYLATFFSAMAALICFVMPAAYHRLARPIRQKGAFKVLANRLLIVGLIPLSLSLPLATYLVTSLAATNTIAIVVSAVVLLLIGALWWVLPLIRAHDQCAPDEARAQHRERLQV